MFSRDRNAHEAQGDKRTIWTGLKTLFQDRSGNFALTFALTTVPLMLAIGCSFDYVQALNTHRKMQSDLDAAIVAAVQHVGTKDQTALKKEIGYWLEAEAETKGSYVLNTSGIAIDTTNSTIRATVSASVPTTFLKIAGINSVPVSTTSAVAGGSTITKAAFSMYLVLDHSQSMSENTDQTYTTTCSNGQTCTKIYTKMEALKLAVNQLTTQFTTADPTSKYVRTAAVAYNDTMSTPSPFAWGVSDVSSYVTKLSPSGMTNSSVAIDTAYKALIDTSTPAKDENKIHQAKNGVSTPKKYIVFMTDGENTKKVNNKTVSNPEADESTRATCDAARTAKIDVYTIAFMAPANGEKLLKYCATLPEYYFPAKSTADLVAAFKSIGESSSKNLVRLTQ